MSVTAVAMSGGSKLLTDFVVKAQDFRTAATPPKNKGGSWDAGQGPPAATGAQTTDTCKDLVERLPATFVYASIIVTDTPLQRHPRRRLHRRIDELAAG
ncbi:hypothetical protein ACWGH4_27225 [Streptomyces sp. NPDC054847]